MNFPDSEFWNFSVQIYALPEVEKYCLDLQNKYDADINIILYCLWISEKPVILNQDDIELLIEATRPWQETILKPLRDARKMMKQHIIAMPSEMMNQTISSLSDMEINAEHMSQLALEKTLDLNLNTVPSTQSPIECASTNLSVYLQQLDSISSVDNLANELSNLLNAVFQDPEAVQVALMSDA